MTEFTELEKDLMAEIACMEVVKSVSDLRRKLNENDNHIMNEDLKAVFAECDDFSLENRWRVLNG